MDKKEFQLVRHELANVVTALQLAARLIEPGLRSCGDPMAMAYLAEMRERLDAGERLVSRLREFEGPDTMTTGASEGR